MTDSSSTELLSSDTIKTGFYKEWSCSIVRDKPEQTLKRLREQAMNSPQRPISFGVRKLDFRAAAVACDVDTTLIAGETIDEMASDWGCGNEVRKITEQAMTGVLDFPEALRLRVARFKGMPVSMVTAAGQRIPIHEGVREFCAWCRQHSLRLFLVSGGFELTISPLARELGADRFWGNRLLIREDGKLSGFYDEENVVDGPAKARLLLNECKNSGIDPARLLIIGDGSNDVHMAKAAGLAAGYQPKMKLIPYLDAMSRARDFNFFQDFLNFSPDKLV